MQSWYFCGVGIAGIFTLGLFCWLLFWRKKEFDAALLGLLTLSYLLLGISIMQPDTIKYGGMELIKQESIAINEKAKETVQLAMETTAMLAWNAGRFDAGGKHNEEIATSLLKELYGARALDYRYVLQRQGLWLTPKEELENIPDVPFPQGLHSPLYDKYLRNLKVDIK